MSVDGRMVGSILSLCLLGLAGVGCASESAFVSFSYVVEPSRGLPKGMKTIYVAPAKVGANTDAKWSELCATTMQALIVESRNQFGTQIEVTDRRDTQVTFDEADAAAAGMTTGSGGSGGQLSAANGAILSNINVKVMVARGKQRTLAGISGFGGGGRGWRSGGGDIRTEEVDTVTRNMVVQTDFRLLDTANNKIWEQYSPPSYRATDRTDASPIFGSSQTEAELTPQDRIIASLVERGAREFVSRLMPCRIQVEADVDSSPNKDCAEGVKLLRAEMYADAISAFRSALRKNSEDHRAAFGAGVACEASGRYDDALKYYKQACKGASDDRYVQARDRMKAFGSRARGS